MKNTQATTSFGFRNVPAEEKQGMVKDVFDAVSSRYDLMNDVMSAGLHRIWKELLIDRVNPRAGMQMLDLAGGTGDVAFRALARFRAEQSKTGAISPQSGALCDLHPANHGGSPMNVTLCDINASMLNEGRNRAINHNILKGITWACGNAEILPFADSSFDVCTIAFGLRNVTHTEKALADIRRVLKPGGHFLCLEFSHVSNDLLKRIYDVYSFHLIPPLGKLLAGDGEPYRYLVESIRRFPKGPALAEMMKGVGFGKVDWKPITGGVVAIHSGWRI